MKVITFNANGIRAAARRGFFTWLAEQDADFICLQETKVQDQQLIPRELYFPMGYFCQYYDAEKKGYSGVAIFAKKQPQNIIKGLSFDCCASEGRYLQFDYQNFSIISLYLPSGTSGPHRQVIKFEFLDYFAHHLKHLKQTGKELILCGDYNIAHRQIDLKNWRSNQKTSGFLPEERLWMDRLFGELGFVDAFRVINQESEQYTWWSQRSRTAWEKNVGWRIDYQVITPGLMPRVKSTAIARHLRCSDHAPLIIEYSGEFVC